MAVATLVLGLLLLVGGLIGLVGEALWASAEASAPLTLPAASVLAYAQARKFDPVDVILEPPFVQDGEANLSLVSVLRFLPWFRRLHLHDPAHEPSRDPVGYWHTHRDQRLVSFHSDLATYVQTSPFLAEHFVVLRPLHVFRNYALVWQFFVRGAPVWRSDAGGAVPFTRAIFNERAYHLHPSPWHQVPPSGLDAPWYWNNRDHFVPPWAVGARYAADRVKQLLQFAEVAKDRTTRPLPLVLAVVAEPQDDVRCALPAVHDAHVQVWLHLRDRDADPDEQLSLTHRMVVQRRVWIDVDLRPHQNRAEKVGADIMKQLHHLSREQPFAVQEVFSYAVAADQSGARTVANVVGNKLARTYNCGFAPFVDPDPGHEAERRRLRAL